MKSVKGGGGEGGRGGNWGVAAAVAVKWRMEMKARCVWGLAAVLGAAGGMMVTRGGAQLPPEVAALRPQGAAGTQIFLKLVPAQKEMAIIGEATEKSNAGEIEVQSYSFGVTNSATIGSATSGAGAGKATFQ